MDSYFGSGQHVDGQLLVAMVQSQKDATPQNATPMRTGRKKVGMSPGGSGITRTPRGWGAMPGTADSDRARTPASRGRVAPGTADSSRYGSSVGGVPPDDEMHEMVLEGVRAALVERADVIQTQQVCSSCQCIQTSWRAALQCPRRTFFLGRGLGSVAVSAVPAPPPLLHKPAASARALIRALAGDVDVRPSESRCSTWRGWHVRSGESKLAARRARYLHGGGAARPRHAPFCNIVHPRLEPPLGSSSGLQ